jgi:Cu/Ag efflux protein CusF
MKKLFAAAFASALAIALTGSALAAEMTAPKPIVVKDKVTLKATVEAIDHTNRTVALKGPKGNVVMLDVDPAVTRFDAMKVGDVVTVDYYESVMYEIKPPGTPATADTVVDAGGKLTGAKPGGAAMTSHVTTVTIMAIDPAIPAVTVKGSDGQVMSFRVRHKENLKGVKVGDQVKVTESAALMIAVESPK